MLLIVFSTYQYHVITKGDGGRRKVALALT